MIRVAMGLGLLSLSSLAQPLPKRAAPAGFTVTEDATGRVLQGAFQGNARSALVVAKGVVASLKGYFDAPPAMSAAIRDAQDRRVQALFSARLAGVPVTGVIAVTLDGGNGSATLLFDRPHQLRASLTHMMNAPARVNTRWQTYTAADGSAKVSLPSDWRFTGGVKGAVDAAGPNGEAVGLGAGFPVLTQTMFPSRGVLVAPFMDPLRAIQTIPRMIAATFGQPPPTNIQIVESSPTASPTGAGQAAFIFYRAAVGGQNYTGFGLFSCSAISYEQWLYYQSYVAAPTPGFAAQFQTMLDIWKSWALNPEYVRRSFEEAMGKMRQAAQILQSTNANTRAAYDRVNKAWSLYIRDNEIVEHTPTGGRWEVSNRGLQSLLDAANQAEGASVWRVVPVSEY